MWKVTAFLSSILAVALAGPALAGTALAGTAPKCDWTIVKTPNPHNGFGDQNALNAVTARSPYDAWAVGQVRIYARDLMETVAEHWNGSGWQLVSAANTPDQTNVLYGVAELGPNNVWAVGYDQPSGFGAPYYTLIEHWNGTAWSIVQSRSDYGVLTSVVAAGPHDLWAVGTTNYPGLGVIEHWDGHRWSYQTLQDAVLLNSVASISPTDIWAVGEEYTYAQGGETTYTLHYDGNTWTRIPSPNPLKKHVRSAQNWLRAVSGVASNDVWAMGETRDTDYPGGLDDTMTLHWDGTQWALVNSSDPGGSGEYNSFWAGFAVSSSEVWAMGDVGLDTLAPMGERWNGSRWNVTNTPKIISNGAFLGVAADDEDNVWAVGQKELKPYVLGTLAELCQRSPR